MTYKINKNPKRESGERPRKRDAIRLEAKRDGALFDKLRHKLIKNIDGKFQYGGAEVKKTGYTTAELTEEIARLFLRAKDRETELNDDHMIYAKTGSQVWKDNHLLLNAWKSIYYDVRILPSRNKEKKTLPAKRPFLMRGKPKTIRIDRAGRKARKTCPELILEAIDIANSFIKSGNESEFNNYRFRLLTIRNMSRDETMESIRMLEVQETIAKIKVRGNRKVSCQAKCFNTVKYYKKYVVYQED